MIVVNFDVLAFPSGAVGARQPTVDGRRLWNVLFSAFNGRMLVFGAGIDEPEMCATWLKRENYKASTVDTIVEDDPDSKYKRIDALRSVYGKITWYIDVDPHTISKAVRGGIPTMLVTIPHVVRPEWTTEKNHKGWDSLVSEIETQRLAWAERNWEDVT